MEEEWERLKACLDWVIAEADRRGLERQGQWEGGFPDRHYINVPGDWTEVVLTYIHINESIRLDWLELETYRGWRVGCDYAQSNRTGGGRVYLDSSEGEPGVVIFVPPVLLKGHALELYSTLRRDGVDETLAANLASVSE